MARKGATQMPEMCGNAPNEHVQGEYEDADHLGKTANGRRRWRRLDVKRAAETMKVIAPLVAAGETHEAIGERLGLSRGQVGRLVKHPDFGKIFDEYREGRIERARDLLDDDLEPAIATLKFLHRNARSEHVRFEAAVGVIDRSRLGTAPSGRSGADEQMELIAKLLANATQRAAPQLVIGAGSMTLQDKLLLPESTPIIDAEVRTLNDREEPSAPHNASDLHTLLSTGTPGVPQSTEAPE